jgi:hypothetical protein
VWLSANYLPGLEEALRFPVELMTIEDLVQARILRQELVLDSEVYFNYFLSVFKNIETGKIAYVEMQEGQALDTQKLKWLLEAFTIVTFNGINYDLPINELAVGGCTCAQLKQASDKIIVEEMRGKDVRRLMKVKGLKVDHIDLIEVAPLFGSLKTYAGRQHARKMQDLPFHPATVLSPAQIAITRWYCVNDTDNTVLLRKTLDDQIELRYALSNEYKVDLRSKSDAQIAEAVMSSELERRTKIRPKKPTIEMGTVFRYKTPGFLQFNSPIMQLVLRTVQQAKLVVDHTGSIAMPEEIKALHIDINGSVYSLGIGGLHSTESTIAYVSGAEYVLIDKDVTSFYPFIILGQGMYPEHLGPEFLHVYRNIVNKRLSAKSAGIKSVAESLKIVINGSYGKFGSQYSILYAPNFLVQTTLTGQLAMLMLIERFELAGIHVVSANTDGIVMRCRRDMQHILDAITAQWEVDTSYQTEETRYLALYSRDVNNYIAIKEKFDKINKQWTGKPDGIKSKGAYANPWSSTENKAMWLHKNPTTTICVEAVEQFLVYGTSVSHTIMQSRDLTKFLTVRSVKGGAVKMWGQVPPAHDTPEDLIRLAGFTEIAKDSWILEGETQREARYGHDAYKLAQELTRLPGETEYVGKTVRWYYAKDIEGELVYAGSGNKVPRSEGARPCMVLPDEFPEDINHAWYISEAVKILEKIGAVAPVLDAP